jgi:hypothetical protein
VFIVLYNMCALCHAYLISPPGGLSGCDVVVVVVCMIVRTSHEVIAFSPFSEYEHFLCFSLSLLFSSLG